VSGLTVSFAANLVFAVLLLTYAIAFGMAWRHSRSRSPALRIRGARARLRALDVQTRPATTVTLFLAVSVVLGAVVGEAL
jgi:hypothetical protein